LFRHPLGRRRLDRLGRGARADRAASARAGAGTTVRRALAQLLSRLRPGGGRYNRSASARPRASLPSRGARPPPVLPPSAGSGADFSPVAVAHAAPDAPRLSGLEFDRWQATVRRAITFIKQQRPDLQLVLALPLPVRASNAYADPLAVLAPRLVAPAAGGLGSAYVQLAYPWVVSDSSADQLGGLAPPDGTL